MSRAIPKATGAEPALPRYVELIRVSTSSQADRETPQIQRRALDTMRERIPGTPVARLEVPEGVSGAKDFDQRPDLQQLERLAQDKAFDQLRVYAVDRITRHPDLRERSAVFGILLDAGATLIDTQGQRIDPREEMGELQWFMQTWGAAQERRKIARRMSDGKRRRAEAGRLAQGQPPFARTFDKTTGAWGIDTEKATIYRRMFDLCLAGQSLNQIAAALNAEGSVTTRGLPWTGSNVCKLLREPTAFGRYTSHGHTFQIPAIVDEGTFRAVDAKLRDNNYLSGPKPTVFALLRKLAVCAVCGAPIYIQKGGGTPARFRYYYCSARGPACHGYHRVQDADAKVMQVVRKSFDDPEFIAGIAAHNTPEGERTAARRDMEEATAILRALDKREENLARLVTKGLVSSRIGEKQLEEIRRLRMQAQATAASARARMYGAERNAEVARGLEATIAKVRREFASLDPDQCREALEGMFPRGGIRIYPNGRIDLSGALVAAWGDDDGPEPSGGSKSTSKFGARTSLHDPPRASGTT